MNEKRDSVSAEIAAPTVDAAPGSAGYVGRVTDTAARQARVARAARKGNGKVHWVAVNEGQPLRSGAIIPPEAQARTLCGGHYFATGWMVVGPTDYDPYKEFCRACDR